MFRKRVCGTYAVMICLIIVLGGCVPWAVTYWQPSGEWGERINPSEVNIAPGDTLEVRANRVSLWFSMWSTETGTFFTIKVRIPEGSSAAFVSNEVLFSEGASSTAVKFESIDGGFLTVSEKERLLPTDIMVGKTYYTRLIGEDEPKSYNVTIDLGRDAESQYTVKPPAIKTDNQVFEMPRIEFNKKTGFGIWAINDH